MTGIRKLIDDMFETMAAAKGVGLAANQVGVAKRVAVIDADGQRFAMVNPRIVSSRGGTRRKRGAFPYRMYSATSRGRRR